MSVLNMTKGQQFMKRFFRQNPIRTALLAMGLVTLFAATPVSAQAPLWLGDWYPTLELQVTADDNINRSFDGDGEKSDVIFAPAIRLERQTQLGDDTYSFLAGILSGAVHGKYNKLNHVAPGVDAGIRRQLGEGAGTSALLAGIGLKYEFHDQDDRFGAEVNPRLVFQLGLSPAVRAGFFYEYDNRFASENSVYDRSGHTFGFDGEVAINEQLAVTFGYSYRNGDVLVHQPRADLGEEIKGKRLPLDTFGDRYDAVKLDDGDTHNVQLGLRYAVSMYTSLSAGFAYEEIKADGDKYPSSQFLFGVMHLL